MLRRAAPSLILFEFEEILDVLYNQATGLSTNVVGIGKDIGLVTNVW